MDGELFRKEMSLRLSHPPFPLARDLNGPDSDFAILEAHSHRRACLSSIPICSLASCLLLSRMKETYR